MWAVEEWVVGSCEVRGVKGGMCGAVNGVSGVGRYGRGDRILVLTVGNTLILDLQVLVSPWAGVWKHI